MKKALSIFLTACIIFALPVSAYAATNDGDVAISPFYVYIDLLSAGLSIDSGGRSTSSGVVQAMSSITTLSLTVSLQQYKNNSWTTLKSWTSSGPGDETLDVTGDYYVSSGYSYRVVSAASVYDKNGKLLETQSKTTSEKSY